MRMFMGVIDGKPTVRVSADDNVAPWDLLPTDYGITRVNTDNVEIGYAYRGRFGLMVTVSGSVIFSTPPDTWTYYPPGSNSSDYQFEYRVDTSSPHRRMVMLFTPEDQVTPRVAFARRDRSNWSSNWSCYHQDWRERYVTYSNNLLSLAQDSQRIYYRFANASQTIGPFLGASPGWGRQYDIGTWWTGYNGGSAASTPYMTSAEAAVYTYERIRPLETELPMNGEPYPAVTGTPAADKTILRITNVRAAMAKPGFDVDTATKDQLIFDSDRVPLKIARTGSFTITSGQTISIPIEYPITPLAMVHDQISKTGGDLMIPPYPGSGIEEIDLQHRIVGQNLEYRNLSAISLDCRFIVIPDELEQSTGTAPVLSRIEGGHYQLRAPGTAGTSDRDILVDTRCAYLPIVKQDWIPQANLKDTPADQNFYGTHMHSISWANDGSWKPFLIATMAYQIGVVTFWQHLVAKRLDHNSYMGHSTFIARVTDTTAKIYFNPSGGGLAGGARFEDIWDDANNQNGFVQGWQEAIGLRYYVFAVPNSL